MKRIWSFFVVLLLANILYAQDEKITFKSAERKGDVVEFLYDLKGIVPGQTFEVKISIQIDGKEQELREVSGDVGPYILEGTDKKITWFAKKELLEFKGQVYPVIEANVTFTPLYNVGLLGGNKLKRGRNYTINWMGGVKDQPVNVELYKGKRSVATLKNNVPNEGKLNITIPKNIKPGSDYRLRILNVLNPTNNSETENIKITRVFPMGVIVVGSAVIVGGVVYYLLSGKEEPEDPIEEGPDPLPVAPDRPD